MALVGNPVGESQVSFAFSLNQQRATSENVEK